MTDEAPGSPDSSGHTRRRARRDQVAALGDEAAVVMYFKERVYATFTGLAIVLVTSAAVHPEADHAFLALVLGVLGITAAGFASELVSHLAVHREFPDRARFAVLLRVAGGAMGTVVVPGVVLLLAWVGVFDVVPALRACVIVFILTLAVIGWFAVRRSKLAWWMQLAALGMLLALGLLVIALQTVAHSV